MRDAIPLSYLAIQLLPSTNLYNIGGDPLTQLKIVNYYYYFFFFFIRNPDSDKINGKDVVGDPLTQLKLIK